MKLKRTRQPVTPPAFESSAPERPGRLIGRQTPLQADAIRHTLCCHPPVKRFNWNADKNEQLRSDRGISFEEILFHIENGDVPDILEHPNQQKYGGQPIFVLAANDYAYLVSFVEDDREVFLQTIIPSRKATKKYLGE